ncbi:MAG: tetratricopeptide repeat protein, partial [bacterium]|nr:tetratricopeptide repeat protein [bacterium]
MTTSIVRVAIVQLDYNLTCFHKEKDYLCEPASFEKEAVGLADLKLSDPENQNEINNLKEKIKEGYLVMIEKKLKHILSFCKEKNVQVVVFPEYSIPVYCLPLMKEYAQSSKMTIIAASQSLRKKDLSHLLSYGIDTQEGRSGTTIFLPDGKVEWIEKLSPASFEEPYLSLGDKWKMIRVKNEYSFSVFLGVDFINGKHKNRSKYCTFEKFHGSNFIIIPAMALETTEFENEIRLRIEKYKRIALYVNTSQGGGSKIYCYLGKKAELLMQEEGKSFRLPKDDEGIIIMDIDLKWQYTEEPSKEVSIAPFIYEGVLPDYEKFLQEYSQEKGTNNKRNYIQSQEQKLFSWWKSKFAPKIFKVKSELLLCGYDRLEEEHINFLVENLFFPRSIPKTSEWRFTYLGRSIELLNKLINKVTEEEKNKIEEVIRYYKRRQQTLKHKVREEYLESYYLRKGKTLESAPLRLEEFQWSYRRFEESKSYEEIKDTLLTRPLLVKEEVEKCFIPTQKVTSFLQKLNFKENYLFLSPPGSGKSSFLGYLSLKALKQGYFPIFISFHKEVPSIRTFLKRLKIEEKERERLVLIFDDIDKNISVLKFILDLKKRFPKTTLYLTSSKKKLSEGERRKLSSFFKEEELPGLITSDDLDKFIKCFSHKLETQELKDALSEKELPIISLVAIYRQLKEGIKTKQEILSNIPTKVSEACQRMYNSLNDGERFALKVISYLDGTTEEVISSALKLYGLDDKVTASLKEKGIIYQSLLSRLSPNFTTLSILDIYDELKQLISSPENTSTYEKTHILPDILIDTEEIEALIALSDKYEELNDRQKEKISSKLLDNKENLSILWVISKLAIHRDEFMKLSPFAIERVKKKKTGGNARILYNYGFAYVQRANTEKAEECFNAAIKIYLDDASAWYNLGMVYKDSGEEERAASCFKEALKVDPDCSIMWYDISLVHRKRNEIEEEMECIKKALVIDKENYTFWLRYGNCYEKLEKYEEAKNCYEKALELNEKSNEAMYGLASAYRKTGNIEKEKECLERILSMEPDYILAWYDIAMIYRREGDFEKEINCLKSVIKIEPDCEDAWYEIGIAYEKINNEEFAFRSYREATRIDSFHDKAWYNLAILYKKRDDEYSEIECYKRAIESNPEQKQAWYNLGIVYRRKGLIKEEIECYEKAIEVDTNYKKAWFNLGVAYSKIKKRREAINMFRKVISIDPEDVKSWYILGVINDQEGDFEGARACFNRCIKINNDYYKAWCSIGIICEKENKLEQAEDYLKKCLEINEDYANAWFCMGLIYSRKHKIDLALDYLDKCKKIDPKHINAWKYMASIYKEKGDKNKEIDCYLELTEIIKDDPEIWCDLGLCYKSIRRVDEAIESFKKASVIDSKCANAYYNLGVIYEEKYMMNRAMDCYEKVVEMDPEYVLAWYRLANLYTIETEFDKKSNCFKRMLALDEENAKGWFDLSLLYKEKNDLENEIECLEKVVAIDSEFQIAWYNLGLAFERRDTSDSAEIKSLRREVLRDKRDISNWLRLSKAYEKDKNINQEMVCLKRILDLEPKNKEALKRMGLVHKENNDFKEAIVCFNKALKVIIDDIEILFGLAETYCIMKDYEKAISVYTKIITVDPFNVKVWRNLGETYKNLGDYEHSIKYYNRLTEMDKDNLENWLDIGKVYALDDNYEEAINSYRYVLFRDSENIKAWQSLGLIYKEIDNLSEAINCQKRIIGIEIDNEKAWYELYSLYRNTKDVQNEYQCLEKLVEICPANIEILLRLAQLNEKTLEVEKSIKYYRNILEIDSSRIDIWHCLAKLYNKNKDKGNIKECYENIIKLAPQDVMALIELARWYEEEKSKKEAKEFYEKVLKIEPENKEAKEYLTHLYH